MNDFSVTFDDSRVQLKLSQMHDKLRDMSKPLDDIGQKLIVFYGIDVFQTSGMRGLGRWKALAPATLMMRKTRQGYYKRAPIANDMPLLWTGKLRSSFTRKVTKDSLTVSNPTDYFRKHQLGEGVPKRPMMMINQFVKDTVTRAFAAYMNAL